MAQSLATVVGPIFGLTFPIQCHHATLYWLCQAQFGSVPSNDEFLEATNIVKRLQAYGAPLSRLSGNFSVRGGTVLVFSENGHPGHSCVTISDTVLGGYNQQNWLGRAGVQLASKYSTHTLTEIIWKTPSTVQGNTAAKTCQLIGINEVSALGNLRRAIDDAMSNRPGH